MQGLPAFGESRARPFLSTAEIPRWPWSRILFQPARLRQSGWFFFLINQQQNCHVQGFNPLLRDDANWQIDLMALPSSRALDLAQFSCYWFHFAPASCAILLMSRPPYPCRTATSNRSVRLISVQSYS